MKRTAILTAVVLVLAAGGCALFLGTARVVVRGVSDQNTSLLTLAQPLAEQMGPREVGFSPDIFKVVIQKVEIVRGVLNPDWQTLFDNGTTEVDIVQGVTLTTSGEEISLTGGEYNGVAITYDPHWWASLTLHSGDLSFVSSDLLYTYTNQPGTNSRIIYWATDSLKQQLTDLGYDVSRVSTLAAPLVLDGSLQQAVLSLVFETENMIRVWTNSDGSYSNHVFLEPELAVSLD